MTSLANATQLDTDSPVYILKSDRPIYLSLPTIYSEFASPEYLTDSAYLVEYFENIYHYWLIQLQAFLDFDGSFSNFTDDQLDALAPFFGFTEPYYDRNWGRQTKIKLFKGVFNDPQIWRFRGSEAVFNYVADALGLKVRLTRPGGFIAGISKAGDVCGSAPGSTVIVVYPDSYFEGSKELAGVFYLMRYFIPLHIHTIMQPTPNFDIP